MTRPVVVLAGGTGGAKLARGLQDEVGADLVVIANTGDDIEIYGSYVSPDPDLITFWLADQIDDRGWGLRGDSFSVMEMLRSLGDNVWFNLGDRDLAICLRRAARLAEGARLTEIIDETRRTLGAPGRVLPMCDEPVRTWIRTSSDWVAFQQFMIKHKAQATIEEIDYRGASAALVTPETRVALATARAIIIGPSNPVISIGPILAVPGLRTAISSSGAPVVAVSPLVNGEVVKGPTAACLKWAKEPVSNEGVVHFYRGLIDGLVSDQASEEVVTFETNVAMHDDRGRRSVAQAVLSFAAALASVR